WFLTVDDGAGDGELRNYLNHPGRWRHYDPELYDKLQRLLDAEVQRSVSRASEWELVPGASYFDTVLRDHRLARAEYFEAARQVLRNSDLVFVDPDNGIEVPSTKLGAAESSKYVYWAELQAMYGGGQSILVYQHFPRVVKRNGVNLSNSAPKSIINDMDAIRIETIVDEHGEVHLTKLPFPAGEPVEVTIAPKQPQQAGCGFPLRGIPITYDRPTDPVAEDEWDAVP
ncbi:MAG: hypothetical protein ACXW6K_13545, partial [Candidatus Binatia bacterium]